MIIVTKNERGRENGALVPLWNANETPDLRPDQVYVTTVDPFSVKGPHLHMKRRGMFAAAWGCPILVLRRDGEYSEHHLLLGSNPLIVPAGVACAIYNPGPTPARLINMPAPAWSLADPDEHPVENWVHPEWWRRSR